MDDTLKKRSEIPDCYKWKLEDLYATDGDWEREAELLGKLSENMSAMEGSLGRSAEDLLNCMEKRDLLNYYLDRVNVYAHQKYHQDTAVPKYQAMADKASEILTTADRCLAFLEPELLEIPEEKLDAFYRELPKLEFYRLYIDRVRRQKEHILSAKEEAILAEAQNIAQTPDTVFSMFNNADLKFPYIADYMGERKRVTHGNFISFMQNMDRSMRRQAFCGVYDSYRKMGNTVAAVFTGNLKQDHFFAKIRGYESTRQMHLSKSEVPESVYDNLIASVHAHLPAMHRYMKLRKKLLGVETLHMYDIYVPIVLDIGRHHDIQEAKQLVVQALDPMGEEYVSVLKKGMDGGWIDVYENEHKRSGAYSWGAYGTHPYVLLNYQKTLSDVFTLAHEMGHSMHTYYSNKNNSITYAGYTLFVAEVASTCNECLLMEYMRSISPEETEQRYLINHQLEQFRTTVFRQTMFAEFEMIVHGRLAAGMPMTMEDLNKIYYDLNVEYYGPDMFVDEEISYEWMRIPHFYDPFYVYQYATGFSAAVAFSQMILKEGKTAADRYINNFLSGGCSRDPVALLASAGVDISSPATVDDALKVFETDLESLIARTVGSLE